MLCERCHEREAVVSIMEIVGGRERKLRLCRECAQEGAGGGIAIMQMSAGSVLEGLGGLGGLLSGLFGVHDQDPEDEAEDVRDDDRQTNVVCPSCKMTFDEFRKYGTFGCPACYDSFGFLLERYMQKTQGSPVHISCSSLQQPADSKGEGLGPAGIPEEGSGMTGMIIDKDAGILELRQSLKRAVAREDFTEAARLRDLIREAEGDAEDA